MEFQETGLRLDEHPPSVALPTFNTPLTLHPTLNMPARRRAAKKMARADKPYDAPIALGAGGDVEVAAALDESSKDDEERELEALLFGRKRVSKQTKHIAETPTVQYDSHLFDSGMGHVADADVS